MRRRRTIPVFILGLMVFITGAATLLCLSACDQEPAKEPGLAACDIILSHRGEFTTNDMTKLTTLFSQTSNQTLAASGSRWAADQIIDPASFGTMTTFVILGNDCKAAQP